MDARLDLYNGCSTLLATANHAGTHYEELVRTLGAGTYRIRVTVPSGAASSQPFVVRFRPMAAGLPVKSSRTIRSGSTVRVVGEVLNDTGTTRGQVTVTATFRDAAGHVVATLRGSGFGNRLADGSVTPFAISGPVATYATVTLSTTAGAPIAVPSLALRSIATVPNGDGTVSETGSVKNTGTRTARSVRIARTWYGTRGDVLEMRVATLSPSTLAPGGIGAFALTRPALPTVQGGRTELRGAF